MKMEEQPTPDNFHGARPPRVLPRWRRWLVLQSDDGFPGNVSDVVREDGRRVSLVLTCPTLAKALAIDWSTTAAESTARHHCRISDQVLKVGLAECTEDSS